MSTMDTSIHRIDPLAKVLTTIGFIVAVVSFGKYEISALIPFFFYPVLMAAAGNIPYGYILKNMIWAAPFAIMIGIFNPILDQSPALTIGTITISGGWLSFFSIMLRFTLTVSSVLVMVACTGINNVCLALEKLGTPRVFVTQIQFLYRYIFVLAHETIRASIARKLRSHNKNTMNIKGYSQLLGHVLLRAIDRSRRIYTAMKARGFDGRNRTARKLRINSQDLIFVLFWACILSIFRFVNVSLLIGKLLSEGIK